MSGFEIRIVCDVHSVPMELFTCLWATGPQDVHEKAWMRCTQNGCSRHFAPIHGYVDLVDGRIAPENRNIKHCESSRQLGAGHGSLALIQLNDGSVRWSCLHQDCGNLTVTAVRNMPNGEISLVCVAAVVNGKRWEASYPNVQALTERLERSDVLSTPQARFFANEVVRNGQASKGGVFIRQEDLRALDLKSRI